MIEKAEISDPEQILKVLSDFRKLPMSQQLLAAATVLQAHATERNIPFDELKMSPSAVAYASAAWARAEERAEKARESV